MKRLFFLPLFLLLASLAPAQILTYEDSLNAGLVRSNRTTMFSGYGEAGVTYDLRYKTGEASLRRNVLFVGHKFSDKISLFTELEIEDALVEGEASHGEIAMEQVVLRFMMNRNTYITAGLFLPRLGIINENHLPVTFNGYDRPFVEQLVIPSVWRELGVGLWGRCRRMPALNYSLALVNGLSSANFEYGTGLREGRFEGSHATASNLAVTGALLYYAGNFRFQVSGYYGGTAGIAARQADSLMLNSGAFGTPVALGEADMKFSNGAFSFTALATAVQIPDASAINRAYGNNTPETMVGGYAEAGCNILRLIGRNKSDSAMAKRKSLTIFARYEYMDLNYRVPENGITNDLLKKQFIVAGVGFQPIQGVVIKADYVMRTTGEPNAALLVNPFPQAQPYFTDNGFFNLGVGYSF